MKDQQHITIQIADQPSIGLDIRRDREPMARKIESNINKVWNKWCHDFKDRTSTEVLAMVTYQYAKLYYELLENIDEGQQALTDFEAELDRILLNVQ